MSLNPISDVKGYGEQDFPLSERAPGNAHQPWSHPKFLKVMAYFLLNLDPNLKISIQSGKKLHKYCEKK